jgi:hypothetical protein
VATPLIESTVNVAFRLGAATAVSTSVLSLTQGVLRTMLLNKLRSIAFAVLVAGGVSTGGVGVWAYQASKSSSPLAQGSNRAPAKVPDPDPPIGFPGQGGGMGLGGPIAGVGGGMGGGMATSESANFAGAGQLNLIRSSSIILAQSADQTAWEAISLEGERADWQRLSLPPGITAVPIMANDVAALMLKGKAIDHVAAFSMYTGTWSRQHLLKPVEGKISPIVGPACVFYQVGNDFYAFSARPGKWGVLHLEGDAKSTGMLSTHDISVLQGDKMYVFNLKRGEWSQGVAIYRRPSQPHPPRIAPAK